MAQTKIAGLFLDPTVISGLTAITSGASDADYLFVWDATDSLLKKILPDNLGLAAAAHTIESHTSTSATGANLETLTNAGDADALHTHALKAPLAGPTFTGTTTFATLSDGAIGITAFLDADNMSGASATTLSTSESIKAYVDANGGTAVAGTTDNGILTFVNSGSTFAAEADLTFASNVLTLAGSSQIAFQGGSIRSPSSTILDIYASTVHQIRMDTGYDPAPDRISIQVADLHVAAGNIVIGTAGKGIDFSAQTRSYASGATVSMQSELLDYYEEGTFTPHIWDSNKTTNANVTYSNRQANYTRIGNRVWFNISWNWSNLTNNSGLTGSSNAYVGGLPFTAGQNPNANIRSACSLGYISTLAMPTNCSMMQARVDGGRADADITWTNTSSTMNIAYAAVTNLGQSGIIDISGNYEVA